MQIGELLNTLQPWETLWPSAASADVQTLTKSASALAEPLKRSFSTHSMDEEPTTDSAALSAHCLHLVNQYWKRAQKSTPTDLALSSLILRFCETMLTITQQQEPGSQDTATCDAFLRLMMHSLLTAAKEITENLQSPLDAMLTKLGPIPRRLDTRKLRPIFKNSPREWRAIYANYAQQYQTMPQQTERYAFVLPTIFLCCYVLPRDDAHTRGRFYDLLRRFDFTKSALQSINRPVFDALKAVCALLSDSDQEIPLRWMATTLRNAIASTRRDRLRPPGVVPPRAAHPAASAAGTVIVSPPSSPPPTAFWRRISFSCAGGSGQTSPRPKRR